MTRSGFDGFIFDMDGTLLHTLPDLVVVTNMALEKEGLPPRTSNEILHFVGNGVMSLVVQAVPDGTSDEQAKRVFNNFKNMYAQFGMEKTKPFDHMVETLHTLKTKGKKLGIVSNKFEQGVKEVEAHFFPDMFDVAHGESETIKRKPDPSGLLATAREMGLAPDRCVYFGDSAGDMVAAHNAGMYGVGVTWGYQTLEHLNSGNPDELIGDPCEILRFV